MQSLICQDNELQYAIKFQDYSHITISVLCAFCLSVNVPKLSELSFSYFCLPPQFRKCVVKCINQLDVMSQSTAQVSESIRTLIRSLCSQTLRAVCLVVSQHIIQFCNEQKEDSPWLWNFKKNKSISSGTCFLYSKNSLQTLNSRRPFWKINELHFQLQFISCQYLSWAAGEGGRVLSKETPSCLSPLPISHQASLSPTQPISQSVHTHRVQAQGNEECAEGRKDKMKKGEVNKGNNVAAACLGGSKL